MTSIVDEIETILQRLGVEPEKAIGGDLSVETPITGDTIALVSTVSADNAKMQIVQPH